MTQRYAAKERIFVSRGQDTHWEVMERRQSYDSYERDAAALSTTSGRSGLIHAWLMESLQQLPDMLGVLGEGFGIVLPH